MDEKKKKQDPVARVLLSLMRGVLVLALFFYLLYHLTSGFSVEMKTQVVKPVSEDIAVASAGAILRDEAVITSDTTGVVSYLYSDGEKVKVGARVATVYSGTSDTSTVARIAEIDRAIELLSLAEVDERTNISDGAAAAREISALLMSASEQIGKGKYGEISEIADNLLTTALRRDTILSDGEGAGATLRALNEERESLVSSLTGVTSSVKAPFAGYFYSYADGGEGIFDFENAKSLTASEYRVKLGLMDESGGNAVGKIVRSPKWYLLLPVGTEEARLFKAGGSYEVSFEADGIKLTMLLEAKNDGENESLLVFSSSLMRGGFSFDRMQNVSVTASTVSGYKLPSSALRVVDGYVGVYIRSGNNIKFRVVEQLYESGAYVFVSTETEGVTLYQNDSDETNDLYCKGLSLYDAVIVSGAKDLSPDRIVN